jgi:hypothetical protein
MNITLKQKLDFQRTAKIITESQYKKLLFENIEIPKELEKKVFDIFNSPKISNAIRKTVSNLSPKDKEKMQSTINSVITENSGDGFSSFKNIVDTVISTAVSGNDINERYSEDVDPESIEYKVGNIAEKLGVAHLMTMGFLPGIVQSVSDYLLKTNFVETFINNTGGDPSVSAAISVAAGLILGGCLWFLGKEMKGEKVTGSTPLFEKSTIQEMASKKSAAVGALTSEVKSLINTGDRKQLAMLAMSVVNVLEKIEKVLGSQDNGDLSEVYNDFYATIVDDEDEEDEF